MKSNDLYYSIAGLTVRLTLPDDTTLRMHPSFEPFRRDESHDDPAMTAVIQTSPLPLIDNAGLLDDTVNDMGRVTLYALPSGDYLVRLSDRTKATHEMMASPDFSALTIALDAASPAATSSLSSLLRIAFSQMVLLHGGISIHASAIINQGFAYLFLGKSGTGKSTHSRLWLDNIPDSELLNDDNPIMRIDLTTGQALAFGSPWSGKTPCYKALSAPVRAILRLEQAPEDHFTPLSDVEAFSTLIPSCSAIKSSPSLHGALCDTVAFIASTIPVGILRCLPKPSAALLLKHELDLTTNKIRN